MPDPITLAALGAVALSEGVKFLYGQAGELLKRHREHRDKAVTSTVAPAPTEPADLTLPMVFQKPSEQPVIHYAELEQAAEPLRALRKDLSDYADGTDPIDPKNQVLIEHIDALRCLMEAVYQHPFTFVGEARPLSEITLTGKIDVRQVLGYVAGVRAKTIKSGNIEIDVKVDRVEVGGELIGVDVETIG
ncbi:MAG: hypothetical protein JWN14_5107 [Chthonomonadales bacterium]|nr:hypothetical protein [Chthonomonadales bacterium]